jgi:molecular chaperone DnaK
VEIHVLQGEREVAAGNRTIGRFILDGIPPAPRGVPQIEVAFDIDANGILSVSAKDKATSKEQSIRIEGSGGLAQEEIDRMIREAEAHASEDHAQREKVEKRNGLDSMIYQGEKLLQENAEKISDADSGALKSAIEEAKKDLESDDQARFESGAQRVEQELHKLAEVLYKTQAAEGADAASEPGADSAGTATDDDVVDAEYTEQKEDS